MYFPQILNRELDGGCLYANISNFGVVLSKDQIDRAANFNRLQPNLVMQFR